MIDVSNYQGGVEWKHVFDSGVRHAYINALNPPNLGLSHATVAARNAGLTVGVYYYAKPDASPQMSASNFLRLAAGDIRPGDMPPALDLEVTEGRDWAYLNHWKEAWFTQVDAEYGTRAVFYSYYAFWKQMTLYADRPVWGAWYGEDHPPDTWTFHQYTAKGHVPGIVGYVDLSHILKDVPVVK